METVYDNLSEKILVGCVNQDYFIFQIYTFLLQEALKKRIGQNRYILSTPNPVIARLHESSNELSNIKWNK